MSLLSPCLWYALGHAREAYYALLTRLTGSVFSFGNACDFLASLVASLGILVFRRFLLLEVL